MQTKRKTNRYISYGGVVLCIFIASFLLGTHWQGTLGRYLISTKSIHNLYCFGRNNLSETFQFDCYSPLKKFQGFKENLHCHVLTNHQIRNSDVENPDYNDLTTSKANYVNFSLDISYEKNIITQSRQPGEPQKEPYTVVKNDTNIIQGLRETIFSNNFGSEYTFITLSKKTGKGMIVWNNTESLSQQADSISSFFFQCE